MRLISFRALLGTMTCELQLSIDFQIKLWWPVRLICFPKDIPNSNEPMSLNHTFIAHRSLLAAWLIKWTARIWSKVEITQQITYIYATLLVLKFSIKGGGLDMRFGWGKICKFSCLNMFVNDHGAHREGGERIMCKGSKVNSQLTVYLATLWTNRN
jgi:hypothetical protein